MLLKIRLKDIILPINNTAHVWSKNQQFFHEHNNISKKE